MNALFPSLKQGAHQSSQGREAEWEEERLRERGREKQEGGMK